MPRSAALLVAIAIVSGCSSGAASPPATSTAPSTSTATTTTTVPTTTTIVPSTTPASTTPTSTATTATPPPSPATTATTPPPSPATTAAAVASVPTTAAPLADTRPAAPALQTRTIGTSVEGRPLIANEYGTSGGTVVLVVGVIHGDEDAAIAVLDDLRVTGVPVGVDLWLLDSINPDGQAHQQRGNANAVDLNRNFPHDWTAIAAPGDWQYSGAGPASEPETQAFMAFAGDIRPALTLWYHQDLFRISPATGREGALRKRYATLTGLPLVDITGGTYTGVASTWVHRTIPHAMSFVIELGPTLSGTDAAMHAAAVLDVAARV